MYLPNKAFNVGFLIIKSLNTPAICSGKIILSKEFINELPLQTRLLTRLAELLKSIGTPAMLKERSRLRFCFYTESKHSSHIPAVYNLLT